MVEDEVFKGTPGLWELITSRRPNDNDYTSKDYENYSRLMIKTNTLYHDNDPKTSHPKSSKSENWNNLLSPIWFKEKEHKKDLRHGIVKGMRERVFLSCRAILMHC